MEFTAEFANLGGLKTGAKVLVSGMDAGEVLSVQVPPRPGAKFRVRFRVLDRFQPILRADSVASIQIEGLVGSKVLQVDAGSATAAALQAGATMPSREPLEIGQLVQQTSDILGKVASVVDDLRPRAEKAFDAIMDVGEQARTVTLAVGSEAQAMLSTGKRIAGDIDTIVDRTKRGQGTVGKLLTDDRLYEDVRKTAEHLEVTTARVEKTAGDVQEIVADLQSRKLGEKVEKTSANVERASAQVTRILAELRPSEADQHGLLDDARYTLQNAREATSDLAENLEALKHNWFFRGFFRQRGFFDLDAISLDEYLSGKVAPGRRREQVWIEQADLFAIDSAGTEILSAEGKKKLVEVMGPYLRYVPNALLMVEGYAAKSAQHEQFLRSRDRGRMVRTYLLDRFGLKPNYVGAIPMGSADPTGKTWDGVAIVHFLEPRRGKE